MAIPRVRILRCLGSGGMGTVWLAEREVFPDIFQRVVVKRPQGDPAVLPRFLEEARSLARVEHANVVQLLDAGEDEGPWLLLEFVDGTDVQTLSDHAGGAGALSPEEIAWVAHEAARGLAAAHAVCGPDGNPAGLVHRDVSPQNVLVSRRGEVKITDFGIAWAADRVSHTSTGTVVGNLRYMSPEQLEGRVAGPPTDVYGLGRVLEVLLAAGLPEGEAAATGERAALARIAAHATQRAPGDRPPDMDAVVLALEEAVPTLVRGARTLAARVGSLLDERVRVEGALAGLLAAERPSTEAPPVAILSGPAPATPPALPARPSRWRRAGYGLIGMIVLGAGIGVAARRDPRVVRPRPAMLRVLQAVRPRVEANTPVPPVRAVAMPPAAPGPPVREEPAVRRGPRAVVSAAPVVAEAPATLRVNALPWAEVSVDGRPAVHTPHEFQLPAGHHELRVRFATGEVRTEPVNLAPGEVRRIGLER